jgi:hypothetical protein
MRRLWLVSVLVACGPMPVVLPDGGLGDEPSDAGLSVDAGAVDAGPLIDAGAADAGAERDAGPVLDGGSVTDAGRPATDGGLVVYPFGRTHSPLPASIVENLRRIAGRETHDDDALMKVGDSITVSTSHLACFAGANVDLDGRTTLQPALDAFNSTRIAGTSPFARASLAATIGWSAQSAINGTPAPLEQELAATNARFATVMFGTNDVGFMNLDAYGRNMFTLVDRLLARGVVPIVSSIPPRDDSMTADALVPWYNGVTRALAQSRQIPYIDLNRELLPLPNHGITTADGVHLNTYVSSGSSRGCLLTPAGLRYGHNVRNLLTLEALSRSWSAVTMRTAADATATLRTASGSTADPLVVDTLPFVDVRDTRRDGARVIDTYSACSTANEGGPEVVYRLEVTRPMTVRATVVSLGTADLDVHLLRGAVSGAACVTRNDKTVTSALMPGTYFVVVDTYVSAGTERSGEYAVVVMEQ